MFRRLRNRFLILNMSIISIVMIAAFVTIYLTTYGNMRSENKNRLDSGGFMLSQKVIKGESNPSDSSSGALSDEDSTTGMEIKKGNEESLDVQYETSVEITENRTEKQVTFRRISPNDSPSFHMIVNGDNELVSTQTFLDMPEEAYQKAFRLAWEQQKNYSVIRLEGREWMYVIKPIGDVKLINEVGGSLSTIESDDSYQITFLDVTDSNHTLFSLLTTFLIVGFVMLFVILLISVYFANRAIQPIEGAWEKQKRFIADASHELKTPLTIIHSNYDALMANKEETIESQMKWLDYIRIGTDRMSKLIGDLLRLAKLDDQSETNRTETFDLSLVALETVEAMEAVIAKKDIRLSKLIENGITIQSDLEKVTQVLSILMDNAVKHTDSSGWIEVSLKKSKHRVSFSVTNSGKGIPNEDIPKIFDRFYQVDASRSVENGGYGLGLSIAKSITDNINGKLNVTSLANESTTFVFSLKA